MNPISVQIKNFQSIESVDFEINGFTCLVGKTNVGKSAIVRAITSALLNNPVVGMVRHDKPHASVRLKSENYDILWEKAERGLNRYHIDGKMYDKVGGNQLKDISELGFKSVKIGSDEILPWYASQFFPIFLLDKTGPQVTDFISDISRLNVIQDAIVISNRRKKRKNDSINLKDKDLLLDKEKLERVSPVDTLILVGKDLDDQRNSIESYEELIESASGAQQSINISNSAVCAVGVIEQISLPSFDYDDLDVYVRARDLYSELSNNAKSIGVIRQISKITLSSIPDEYLEYQKILSLPDLDLISQRAAALTSVDKVTVPNDTFSDDIGELRTAESLHQKVRQNDLIVSGMGNISMPNEDLLDEYEKYRSLVSLAQQMSSIAKDARTDKNQLSSIDDELRTVESQLAEIPTCSTCKQPVPKA